MQTVVDAELLVTKPGSSAESADFVIPNDDIAKLTVDERAGRQVAKGKLTIDAANGQYVDKNAAPDVEYGWGDAWGTMPWGGALDTAVKYGWGDAWGSIPWGGSREAAPVLDIDDKIEIRVAGAGAGTGSTFGGEDFGDGSFGSAAWRSLSTVIVTDGQTSGQVHTQTLDLSIENFVFNRLRNRNVNEYGAEDRQISGSEDAILNEILTQYVPDVDTSKLPTITDTLDYWCDKKKAHTVVDEIARLAHGATGESWVLGADGEALTLRALNDLSTQWTAGDGQADFEGTFEHSWGADPLVNEVRVEGGIDSENVDEEETAGGSFATVTNTSRLTYQLSPRKPVVGKVRLWVRHVDGSDADLRVRLQSDDGADSPVDIDDSESDLTNKRVGVPADYDDSLDVRFGEHMLGPKDTPHLIIEATNDGGVEIETDGAGTPKFQSHFPKPIIVRVPDIDSQERYRIHDQTVDDDSIQTFRAAFERARRELDVGSDPQLEFQTEASSDRAHALDVGDIVTLDWPKRRAEGDYIVTGVSHSYEGPIVKTSLTLKSTVNFA